MLEPKAVESIQYLIMTYADLWAKLNTDEYFKGIATGLVFAYRRLVDDEKGYREYMAMLGDK